jgi:hypothetical protein
MISEESTTRSQAVARCPAPPDSPQLRQPRAAACGHESHSGPRGPPAQIHRVPEPRRENPRLHEAGPGQGVSRYPGGARSSRPSGPRWSRHRQLVYRTCRNEDVAQSLSCAFICIPPSVATTQALGSLFVSQPPLTSNAFGAAFPLAAHYPGCHCLVLRSEYPMDESHRMNDIPFAFHASRPSGDLEMCAFGGLRRC